MDLAHFMDQRLKFVEYFHMETTAHFAEIVRKIEAGEPPYVDNRNPEFVDEPAFLAEWQDADAAMTLSGAACLDVLQSTFHAFLDEYMKQLGLEENIPKLKGLNKKSWLGNYRAYFADYLDIPWEAAGVNLELLEQLILTRNDFTHNVDLLSLNAFQTPTHLKKYPDSAFADPRWKDMSFRAERAPLIVPAEILQAAVNALRVLCEHLDRERYGLPKRLREKKDDHAAPPSTDRSDNA